MAVVTIEELKTYFQTGDKPTEQEFINLIDTLVAAAQGGSPDATPTVKGILKLYGDLSSSNTDGTATQAAIKAALDSLSTAIAGKQSTLVSGTNLKTLNSTTLLGSGDISVEVAGAAAAALSSANAYTDSAIEGQRNRQARIASTGNLGLSSLSAIDGITPIAGDRILAKDQSTASENGIYVASAGAWSRATDYDSGTEIRNTIVNIAEGTVNGDTSWRQTADTITIGVTSIVFIPFGVNVPFATESISGKTKLYDDVAGNNTDGAPDQNSVNVALALKEDISNKQTAFPATPSETEYLSTKGQAGLFWLSESVPSATDDSTLGFVANQSRWRDISTQLEYICTDDTPTAAVWLEVANPLTLNVNTTAVGNVGSGEDDLITYELPRDTIAVDGHYLSFEMAGKFVGIVGTERLKVKMGTRTLHDTGALSINLNSDWSVKGTIIRTSPTDFKSTVVFDCSLPTVKSKTTYLTSGVDFTTDLILKATGESTTDDDIIQELLIVKKNM